jgi:hypothetical protein
MSSDLGPHQQRRQDFLTLFLTFLGGAFFLFVLVLLTGGLFFYVGLAFAGIAALGALHYLLWGKVLSDAVAGEREEEQLRRRAADEDWPPEDWPPPSRRRFER